MSHDVTLKSTKCSSMPS